MNNAIGRKSLICLPLQAKKGTGAQRGHRLGTFFGTGLRQHLANGLPERRLLVAVQQAQIDKSRCDRISENRDLDGVREFADWLH